MARVFAFPATGIGYIDGFYGALRGLGVEVREGLFACGWLFAQMRRGDIAHLHWPSFLYSAPGRARLLLRFGRFAILLLLLRLRGVRLVWTAHNLLPHEPSAWPWLDRLGRRLVIALSERIAVHGASAAALLCAAWPAAAPKLLLIPHGHFADQYPSAWERAPARRELGLPEQGLTLLMLGQCKPYKRVLELIRLHRRRQDDLQLLIAGSFGPADYEAACRAAAADDPRILIRAGYIPDERLQAYLVASDLFVIPYREILTSGSAVLAASFGLPVVSIARGFLCDFIGPDMGLLCPPEDDESLQRCIDAALARRWDAARIVANARQHRFEDAAQRFKDSLGVRS